MTNHEDYMNQALQLAEKARDLGEVPVGAVVVTLDGRIVGRGYNQKEGLQSAIAHAEIMAIKEACETLKSWRLTGCTLYVTLEPCPMCSGAIWASQIGTVVFGASDLKTGYLKSLHQVGEDSRLNHRFETIGGILENECSQILKQFFKELRNK
jgi:tRNA(adenine34) deaminase